MGFRVNHVHLKSPDPRGAAHWYIENLGATVTAENVTPGGRTTYRLDLHGLPLNVTDFIEGQKSAQHYGMEHLAVDTDDFDAVVARIKGKGAKVIEERTLPDGRRVCFFEGPDGVRLEFMEMARR